MGGVEQQPGVYGQQVVEGEMPGGEVRHRCRVVKPAAGPASGEGDIPTLVIIVQEWRETSDVFVPIYCTVCLNFRYIGISKFDLTPRHTVLQSYHGVSGEYRRKPKVKYVLDFYHFVETHKHWYDATKPRIYRGEVWILPHHNSCLVHLRDETLHIEYTGINKWNKFKKVIYVDKYFKQYNRIIHWSGHIVFS